MHLLGRFFHGLWRGLDALRRLLHLLLLLALFGDRASARCASALCRACRTGPRW